PGANVLDGGLRPTRIDLSGMPLVSKQSGFKEKRVPMPGTRSPLAAGLLLDRAVPFLRHRKFHCWLWLSISDGQPVRLWLGDEAGVVVRPVERQHREGTVGALLTLQHESEIGAV